MKFDEILANITMLAETQGFYREILSRLQITEVTHPSNYNKIKELLEKENFKDIFEMCNYFEKSYSSYCYYGG